jgi:hypothetical protein
VLLYHMGLPVGRLQDVLGQLGELIRKGEPLEFRTDAKEFVGYYQPTEMPICPWHPELTREDIDRMSADGGGMPLADLWKKLGVA